MSRHSPTPFGPAFAWGAFAVLVAASVSVSVRAQDEPGPEPALGVRLRSVDMASLVGLFPAARCGKRASNEGFVLVEPELSPDPGRWIWQGWDATDLVHVEGHRIPDLCGGLTPLPSSADDDLLCFPLPVPARGLVVERFAQWAPKYSEAHGGSTPAAGRVSLCVEESTVRSWRTQVLRQLEMFGFSSPEGPVFVGLNDGRATYGGS